MIPCHKIGSPFGYVPDLSNCDIRSIPKQRLKRVGTLTDHAECVLQSLSQVVQLMNDAAHRQCIRKEQQLSRPFDISVLDHIKMSDRSDLDTTEL